MNDDKGIGDIARRDQYGTAVADLAVMLGDYYKKLQEQGFSKEEAFSLITSYQIGLVKGFRNDS